MAFQERRGERRELARQLLEAVDFELLLLGQVNLDEELADILALVSLKLDHFTILWVLNHCPIAGKLLLEGLD